MINFIGIGAQKCASSWIYEVLKNSKQASLSSIKETDFFSYYYDKGYEWYESNFDEIDNTIVGEISPSYLYNSDVPKRVFEYNPNMKIILSMRNPIKRMYSNHLHEVRAGNISGSNLKFENAMQNNPLYFEQSCYAIHIEKWLKYFDLKNIHFVFQEDVSRSPKEVSDSLCDFLEIDRLPLIEIARVNESLKDKSRFIGQIFNFGGNIFRKLGFKKTLNIIKSTGVLSTMYKQNKVHISEIVEPLTPEVESHLHNLFESHDSNLKKLIKTTKLPWESDV